MAVTNDIRAELSKLQQNTQHAWLLEVEVPTDTTSRYRLNNSAHSITFGTDSGGEDQVYVTFPFEPDGVREDGQGGIYSLTVTASNVKRELMAAIEAYEGLIDQPARVMLVHKGNLGGGEPIFQFDGRIATHKASAQSIQFTIGRENLYRVPLPLLRTSREFCNHIYGGVECGYDTTRSGALQTCTFMVEGDNGCRAHGEDEEDEGLPVLHPLRFGGQLGVPRRQGVRL